MSEIFNVSTNPHVRSKDTTQTIMRDVLIALAPASIFGIYNFGVQALIRIIVGIVVCMASEAVYEYFMHKKITVMDLSAAVTGLLIALNIPSTLNIGFEIVGCVFAIIIVKQLFGGIGQNFMNPALAARCFLLIAYKYLFIMAVFLWILYLLHVYRSAIQGLGNTLIPLASGIAEFVMRVSVALLLPKWIGEEGIYYAEICAWSSAAVLLIISYMILIRKYKDAKTSES